MAKYLKNYYYILFCVIIFVMATWYLPQIYQPTLMDDEFAYWGIAQYFDGTDWSSVMSYSRYYSYGYSFVLYIILQFFKNPVYMYRAAVAVNGLLLCGTFLVMDSIFRKIFSNTDRGLICAVSFLMTVMPCNLAFANVTLTENLLLFVFCVIVRLFCDMDKDFSIWKSILLGILLVYSYMVHQRMIGVMAAAVIVLIAMCIRKKIGWKQGAAVAAAMIVMMAAHIFIKADLKDSLWLNSAASSVNDYGSLSDRLVKICSSVKGIAVYGISVLGKLFYFASATYMVGIAGLAVIIRKAYKSLKDNADKMYIYMFILLSFLLVTAVAAIFFYNPLTLASLLYGRYMELLYPLVTGIGIIWLYETGKANYRKVILMLGTISVVYLVSGMVLKLFAAHRNLEWLNYISCSQMYKYMSGDHLPFIKTMAKVLLVTAAFALYLGIKKYKKQADIVIIAAVVALSWYTSDFSIKAVNLPLQKSKYESHGIVDYIKREGIGSHKIYYYVKEDESTDTSVYREYMQYWLQDKPVYCVTEDELGSIKEGSWLIISDEDSMDIGSTLGMERAYKNTMCVMWEK